MMRHLLWTIILCFFILLAGATSVYAVECGEEVPSGESELQQYIASCNAKINASKGQQATLGSAIKYLNNQIGLTQAQIKETETQLTKLELEIQDLTGKISGIDYSLQDLTKLFISRVQATYKQTLTNTFASFMHNSGITDWVVRQEYLGKVRDNDQKIMITLEKTRLDYDAQKTLKEAKQKEIEQTKIKLASQQRSLSQQKAEKDTLLAATKNDETKYQSLRREAQNRVIQLANYANSRGGGTLLSGTTKCDDWGCYYNQRDAQWGSQGIGNSGMPLSQVGCLVASAAMVATHYGKSLTPQDIATSTNPFEYDTADMRFNWLGAVNGTTVSRTPVGCSGNSCLNIIDQELAANRPVIARITAANVAGTHFIVITKKEGDNYIMKDPFEADGNNISFTSKHQISSLTRIDKVSVN